MSKYAILTQTAPHNAVQSTIQREIGLAVVKIGCNWRPFRRQHVVLLLTLYVLSGAESTALLALFVSVELAVCHK